MPASAAFVVHNKKFILILRDNSSNISDPNTWELPGGIVEFGESFEEALIRELKEEISLVPNNIKELGCLSVQDGSIGK